MILETNRLVILSVAEPSYDKNIRTVVQINGIFVKPDGTTAERLKENPSFISKSGSPIGLITLGENGWIDYSILRQHRKNGYATEALEAVKKFALENNKKPFLVIDNSNISSITVAKKCGFKCIAKGNGMSRYM